MVIFYVTVVVVFVFVIFVVAAVAVVVRNSSSINNISSNISMYWINTVSKISVYFILYTIHEPTLY